MITKKLDKITWAFEPSALNGKGYWFIYGKNGALGRAATQEEYRNLGRPSEEELYPKKDAEKEKSEEPPEEKEKSEEPLEEKMSDEEKEKLLAEDALRRNRRARYYGKLTQTSSKYETANIVRGKTYGQIVSERMLRGEGGASAFKGALGEKIGAVGMGIREKFDPIRLLNKVPIVGSALATMYGMKRGRSAADISYFTGAGRFLQQQQKPGKLSTEDNDTGLASKVTTSVSEKIGTATKIGKNETSSSNAPKNINNVKTTLGALKKLYSLEKMWYDEEKKTRDQLKRDRQIAQNFKEEQEMERHSELMKALTGKDSKIKKKDKDKKEESTGFFGGLLDLFKNFIGIKLLDGLFSVMRMGIMGLLRGAVTLLLPVLAPLLPILGAFAVAIAGIVAVTKGIDWLISKFTGKNADYYKMKLDEKTTPEDVKKIIKDPGRLIAAESEKQYEINKKIVETGKGSFGQKLGQKSVEEAKKRIEDYEKLKAFKQSDDPFQTYKREVDAGRVTRETSFEDWKKQQSMSGAGDKSLPRNLRNNNPGNIRFKKGGFAEKFGATGADDAGFAIFPTMEAGEKAQKYLLFESESKDKSQSYKNLTVDQAVAKYAPSSENNTGAYQNLVKKELGSSYDPNKKLSEYSSADQQKIVTAMQKMEGGTVEGYKLAKDNKSQPMSMGNFDDDQDDLSGPDPTPEQLKAFKEQKQKDIASGKIQLQMNADSGFSEDEIYSTMWKAEENKKRRAAPELKIFGKTIQTASKVPEKPQLKIFGKTIAELTGKKKSTDLADQEAEQLIADARDSGALSDPGTVKQISPMAKADALSSRMNAAVSENKNLTSNQQNIPPIVMNTTNNMNGGKGGGQSTPMGPTPIRNDEPMLLRSQYGIVKPV